MQVRLRDYVEDREHLAAALAHDLRTPLTRMRLRLELLRKSTAREALAHDLADIESIASSVIDFATFEVTEEKSERIDFWSLVESIADGFEDVSFDDDDTRSRGLICMARPVALKRCVTNLVQNAVTYGKKAHLSLRQSERDDHADHPRRGAGHTAGPARRGVRLLRAPGAVAQPPDRRPWPRPDHRPQHRPRRRRRGQPVQSSRRRPADGTAPAAGGIRQQSYRLDGRRGWIGRRNLAIVRRSSTRKSPHVLRHPGLSRRTDGRSPGRRRRMRR